MTISIVPNTNPEVLRVFIVRHGQTDHNVKKILQGHTDIDLNPTGIDQARKLGQVFLMMELDDIISSDLSRCQNTVKEIAVHHQKEVELTPAFRERNMGIAEGMYLKDALAKYGESFREFGEKKEQFKERVDREFTKVVKRNSDSKNILICTHGGTITMFVNYLHREKGFKLHRDLSVENLKVPFNTSVAVVDLARDGSGGVIQEFGNTEHLGGRFEVKDQMLRWVLQGGEWGENSEPESQPKQNSEKWLM